MKKRKVTILGSGHVGSHVALTLAYDGIADEIVLVDKIEKLAKGQALDIYDTMSVTSHEVLVRAGDYSDVQDSDVVVCAIGRSRVPSENRVDMLADSIVMCDELLDSLKPYKIPGIFISITNPCDVIADYMRKGLGLDWRRAFGTGTLLDTVRLKKVIGHAAGVARSSVQCVVMGEHGESSMIPFSLARVGTVPYKSLHIPEEDVLQEVRRGGWVIVEGKACTEFGIGRAASAMVACVLRDEQKVLPASVVLHGEYGEKDVQIGVPCVIGADGIKEVLEVPMTSEELTKFHHSCDVVRGNIAAAAKLGKQN